MIAGMLSNEKLNPIVTELFIIGRKLNISVFIAQSYFAVPKNIRLNSTHYFVMKIPNKRELQQIAFNHSPDIQHFMTLFKKFTAKPYTLLVIDTLASDNSLFWKESFRKNIKVFNICQVVVYIAPPFVGTLMQSGNQCVF